MAQVSPTFIQPSPMSYGTALLAVLGVVLNSVSEMVTYRLRRCVNGILPPSLV
ncbi:MAG: hypothetical protein RMK18_01310 [Armatimonadota bacterium]|nr:hypothetical protein [Armatimonadota bacterium]MDW8024493.1 hypothetical protein [Armatimonadota bacterium]